MVGSASAPQTETYNQKLSERRNDSVKKWMLNYTLSDGKKISEYGSKFTMNFKGSGEEIVIPQTKKDADATSFTGDTSVTTSSGGDILSAQVNCTDNIINLTTTPNKSNSQSQWYSIPAMACRRVIIQKVVVTTPPEKVEEKNPNPIPNPEDDSTPNPQNILTGQTQSIKPEPKITIEQKIKEGISKKILRNLFTE
jgi:hypothetical protein